MSKLTKLMNNPSLFFKDFFEKRFGKSNEVEENLEDSSDEGDGLIFAFHINDWKRDFLVDFFFGKKIIFIPFSVSKNSKDRVKWKKIISAKPKAELLIWGMNSPSFIAELSNKRLFIEDGFIRSVGLGASHTLPFSLTIDSRTPYFDSTQQSDMEEMLLNFDFSNNPDLLLKAKELINLIIKTGISKYNNSEFNNSINIYGAKSKKRILVIGQVEDDASIKYGSLKRYNNNDLVNIARMENPDAEIFYKPHPDVMARKRKELSNPNDVAHICKLLLDDVPLAQAFETIDHVYTITSQAGFEALMRGIKVTTVGAPFYSGWGLTDDRQLVHRRNRKLTLEQVFVIAYILYPVYYNPFSKEKIDIEDAINCLLEMRRLSSVAKKNISNNEEIKLNCNSENELIPKDQAIKMSIASIKQSLNQIESLLK